MNFRYSRRPPLTGPLIVLLLLAAVSCGGPRSFHELDVAERSDLVKNAALLAELDRLAKSPHTRHVLVEGPDHVILPPTAAFDEPAEERIYTFDVYIDGDSGTPTLDGENLEIEVLGAKARKEAVSYSDPEAEAGIASRRVVRITLRSSDIDHSFTILAWNRSRFMDHERARSLQVSALLPDGENAEVQPETRERLERVLYAPNPWGEIKRVAVFGGDLLTKVELLSLTEAEDAFGANFSHYFHVGKVYFRNQHQDKKLVVNTTSLRAKCLFYREPDRDRARAFQSAPDRDAYLLAYARQVSEGLTTPAGLTAAQARRVLEHAADTASNFGGSSISLLGRELGLPIEENPLLEAEIRTMTEQVKKDLKGLSRPSASRIAQIVDERLTEWLRVRTGPFSNPRPIAVSPTAKPLASSEFVFRQGALLGTGYVWHDYYRPMTFNAVLISLIRKTEDSTKQEFMDVLRSLGTVAGALIGLEFLGGAFAGDNFPRAVAVTTGVVLPEARQLLLDDLNQFITNLGNMGLETVIEIPPNGVVDGYVFFPKGPIFGFGVGEFDVNAPSYIVNIDNTSVAVDGILVDKQLQVASGEKTGLIAEARGRLQRAITAEEEKAGRIQSKVDALRVASTAEKVRAAIDAGQPELARRILDRHHAIHGRADPSGALDRLEAELPAEDALHAAPLAFLEIRDGVDHPVTRVVLRQFQSANGDVWYGGAYALRLAREIRKDAAAEVAVHGLAADPAEASPILFDDPEARRSVAVRTFTTANWAEAEPVTVFVSGAAGDAPARHVLQHTIASPDSSFTGRTALPLDFSAEPVSPELESELLVAEARRGELNVGREQYEKQLAKGTTALANFELRIQSAGKSSEEYLAAAGEVEAARSLLYEIRDARQQLLARKKALESANVALDRFVNRDRTDSMLLAFVISQARKRHAFADAVDSAAAVLKSQEPELDVRLKKWESEDKSDALRTLLPTVLSITAKAVADGTTQLELRSSLDLPIELKLQGESEAILLKKKGTATHVSASAVQPHMTIECEIDGATIQFLDFPVTVSE